MKGQSKLFATVGILTLSFAMVADTFATVLIFNNAAGGPVAGNASPIPQAYGDNVTASIQGGFSYGVGAEGFTPDVIAEYGTALGGSPLLTWDNGFGDLSNVACCGAPTMLMGLTTPSPGKEGVRLYSFDLGGFPGTVGGVRSNINVIVQNELLTVLFQSIDSTVSNSPSHTSYDFSSNPLLGQSIYISIFLGNNTANYGNIGLDNIVFGEIPEPGCVAFVAASGLLLRRRMKRTK